MSAAFSLSRISTNVRFSASTLLFPELAGAWAERMFLTPPRASDAAASALDLIDARNSFVEHKRRLISTWRWGSRDAPAVLLAHGWGGNAAQMRGFVFPLLQAGYRVIAYDQPAHGVSEGKLTGLPDFADVLGEVAAYYGNVQGVIAHSLGAYLWLHYASLTGAVHVRRALLVAPPGPEEVRHTRRIRFPFHLPLNEGRIHHAAPDILMVGTDADPFCARGFVDTYARPLYLPYW